jgi:hypothetical protein
MEMTNVPRRLSQPSRPAAVLGFAAAFALPLFSPPHPAIAQHWELASTDGLRLHNVSAEPAAFAGKRAVRITISSEAQAVYERLPTAPPLPRGGTAAASADFLELLALVTGGTKK